MKSATASWTAAAAAAAAALRHVNARVVNDVGTAAAGDDDDADATAAGTLETRRLSSAK